MDSATIAMVLMASGVFYIICSLFLWKPMREGKNELIAALFAFLVYQAINMFAMGLEVQTMNMNFAYVSALAILIGSTYMLKFPLSSFSQKTRRFAFTLSLIVVLGLFVWFIQTPESQNTIMTFALWYDLIINGLIVGGFMLLLAIRTVERYMRIKALGGGSGVIACCVVANGAILSGAMPVAVMFGFLAPILIVGSLMFTRRGEAGVKAFG